LNRRSRSEAPTDEGRILMIISAKSLGKQDAGA